MVLAYGWNRFMVVGVGAPPVGMAMAYGMATLLWYGAGSHLAARSDEKKKWSEKLAIALVSPLIMWAILGVTWEFAR